MDTPSLARLTPRPPDPAPALELPPPFPESPAANVAEMSFPVDPLALLDSALFRRPVADDWILLAREGWDWEAEADEDGGGGGPVGCWSVAGFGGGGGLSSIVWELPFCSLCLLGRMGFEDVYVSNAKRLRRSARETTRSREDV